jgi:hypothetical protein
VNYVQIQNEVSEVKARNPFSVPIEKQIRIDLDRYSTGDVCQLAISGVLGCDMREYRIAIRFLEDLHIYQTISREVFDYARGLIRELVQIEKLREEHGGAAFERSWLKPWHRPVT